MGDDEREPEQVMGELVSVATEDAQNSGRQPIGRPWPKGVSGCPGGRPKAERDIVELARQRGPEVIKRLFYIAMRGNIKNPTTVLAAKLLLERGYGRAPMTIAGADGRPLTDSQGRPLRVGGIIIMPAERGDDDSDDEPEEGP